MRVFCHTGGSGVQPTPCTWVGMAMTMDPDSEIIFKEKKEEKGQGEDGESLQGCERLVQFPSIDPGYLVRWTRDRGGGQTTVRIIEDSI